MIWYLTAMFLIPLLDTWDRWVTSRAAVFHEFQFFELNRWWQVLEGLSTYHYRDVWCRIWVFRIPFVRTWGPTFANYGFIDKDWDWREHYLLICCQIAPHIRVIPPFPE